MLQNVLGNVSIQRLAGQRYRLKGWFKSGAPSLPLFGGVGRWGMYVNTPG
jgi:hypothetical protein